MSIQTRPYDAAHYLHADAQCAAYLNAVLAEPSVSTAEVVSALTDIARARGTLQSASAASADNPAVLAESAPAVDAVITLIRKLGLRLRVETALPTP